MDPTGLVDGTIDDDETLPESLEDAENGLTVYKEQQVLIKNLQKAEEVTNLKKSDPTIPDTRVLDPQKLAKSYLDNLHMSSPTAGVLDIPDTASIPQSEIDRLKTDPDTHKIQVGEAKTAAQLQPILGQMERTRGLDFKITEGPLKGKYVDIMFSPSPEQVDSMNKNFDMKDVADSIESHELKTKGKGILVLDMRNLSYRNRSMVEMYLENIRPDNSNILIIR